MIRKVNRGDVIVKLIAIYPYADDRFIRERAERLCRCDSALCDNLQEWLSEEPFSDVYIRGKYTLNMVLHIREYDGRGEDFVDAFLALDDYAADENTETGLWRVRL